MSRSKIITSTLLIVTFFNPKELSSLRYALITLITLWTQMITMVYGQQRILGGGNKELVNSSLDCEAHQARGDTVFCPHGTRAQMDRVTNFQFGAKT